MQYVGCNAEVGMKVRINENQTLQTEISLRATATTLYPCSKEISEYSALIHPVLKRPDEKTVTETAYENP